MAKAILLVDDELMIREVVQEVLSHLGLTFYEAGHGVEALAMLENHPDIALVISDIKMPVMDGIQFISEAREKGFQQPFIIFSAFANSETLKDLKRFNVAAFIEKGQMLGFAEKVLASLNESIK